MPRRFQGTGVLTHGWVRVAIPRGSSGRCSYERETTGASTENGLEDGGSETELARAADRGFRGVDAADVWCCAFQRGYARAGASGDGFAWAIHRVAGFRVP